MGSLNQDGSAKKSFVRRENLQKEKEGEKGKFLFTYRM